jgi:PAS domain S-box-containing protein
VTARVEPTTGSRDDRFRLAMESAGIGMAIVGADGVWREVNPALCRLLGHPREALLGRNVHEFTHPDDLAATEAAFAALRDGRRDMLDFEKRYLHRDGRVLWVQLNTAAVRGADGKPECFISQLRDVSAQRAAEQELRALNERLEQRVAERTAELEALNHQLELFAFGVSHDLRGPLRAIDGFVWLLEQHNAGQLDATGREHLGRIRAATVRMVGMIDGLLELSRATRAVLHWQNVDLSLLADWVGAELQDAEPGRAAEVSVQPGLTTHGDERLLKLLLNQLMGNAWKFSRERDRVRIEVGGHRDAGGLQLWVRDFGSGFDMAYAGKLFEPFQRLHGAEQACGNGLGLAIARRVVERHGGRISAESKPGFGSTFRVWLPERQERAA